MNSKISPHSNAENIKKIKESLVQHFADDEMEFSQINQKLDQLNFEKDTTHLMIKESLAAIQNAIRELSDKVNPVVNWFDGINFSKRVLLFILGILGSVLAIAIGIKNLLR